jgi:transposase
VVTDCFTGFTDSRKFACYAGIAPFEKQSGTSLKTKARVSHYANKKIKSLLNLSASSAILAVPELKAYNQRRVESGKSKMSTLNIVRNKIVHRIFAVVKRGTPYVSLYKHAA